MSIRASSPQDSVHTVEDRVHDAAVQRSIAEVFGITVVYTTTATTEEFSHEEIHITSDPEEARLQEALHNAGLV